MKRHASAEPPRRAGMTGQIPATGKRLDSLDFLNPAQR
jgi:hypothetical protein